MPSILYLASRSGHHVVDQTVKTSWKKKRL